MTEENKLSEVVKRLTPKQEVVRRLYLLSGNECAEPSCNNVLFDANQTMIGEIAHIASAMPTGKRFDSSMTNETRRAFENLLLLCPNHHTQVDGANAPHTREQLKKWKADHEGRFAAAAQTLLKNFSTKYPDAINELTPTKPLTFEAFQVAMGKYGLTEEEIDPTARQIADYVDRLRKGPPDHRDFMLSVLKAAVERDSIVHERACLLCDEIVSSLGVSASNIKRLIKTLEKYDLAWFNEDFDGNPTVEIHNPCEEMTWPVIAKFAELQGIDLQRFVIELQFGDLD